MLPQVLMVKMSRRMPNRATSNQIAKPKRLQCETTVATPLPKPLRTLLPRHPSATYAYEAFDSSDVLLPFVDGLMILSEQAGECCLPPTTKVLCALVDGKVQFYSRHSLVTRDGLDLLSTTGIPFIPRTASECSNILARWHRYHQRNTRPFSTWRCLIIGASGASKHADVAAEGTQRCAMVIRSGGGTVLECVNEELDSLKFVEMQVTHLLVADEICKPIKQWVDQNSLSPVDVLTFSRLEEMILSDEFFVTRSGVADSACPSGKSTGRSIFPCIRTELFANAAELTNGRLNIILQNLIRAPPENKAGLADVEGETLNHVEDQLGDRSKVTDDSLFIALSLLPLNDVALPAELILHMFRVALEGFSVPSISSVVKQEKAADDEDIQEDIFFNGCACLRWFALWQENNVHHLPTTRNILAEICRTLCRQYANTTAEQLVQLKLCNTAEKAKVNAASFYNFIFMLLTDDAPDLEVLEQINRARGASNRKHSKRHNNSADGPTTKQNTGSRKQNGSSKIVDYDEFAEESSSSSSSSDDDETVGLAKKNLSKIKRLSEGNDLKSITNQISLAQLKIQRFLVRRLAAERFVKYLKFDLSSQIVAATVAAETLQSESAEADNMEAEPPATNSVHDDKHSVLSPSVIAERAQQCFSSPLNASPAVITLLFPAASAKPGKLHKGNADADEVITIDDDDESGSTADQRSNAGSNKPVSGITSRRGRGRRAVVARPNANTSADAGNRKCRISPADDIQFLCPRICDDVALRLVRLIENEIRQHILLRSSSSSAAAEESALPANFINFDGLHQFLVHNKTFVTWIELIELIFDAIAFELCTYYSSGSPVATQQYCWSIMMPIVNTFTYKLYQYCCAMPNETEQMRLAVFLAVAETTRHPLLRNAVLKCYITADEGASSSKSAFVKRCCSIMPFETVCRIMLKHDSLTKSTFKLPSGSWSAQITQSFISQLLRSTHEVNIKPFIGIEDACGETNNVHARILTGVARACDAQVITLADLAALDGTGATSSDNKNTSDRWMMFVRDIVLRAIKDVRGASSDFDEEMLLHFGETCVCYQLMNNWLVSDIIAHQENAELEANGAMRPPPAVRGNRRGRTQKEDVKHPTDNQEQIAAKWKRIREEFFS